MASFNKRKQLESRSLSSTRVSNNRTSVGQDPSLNSFYAQNWTSAVGLLEVDIHIYIYIYIYIIN